MVNFNGPVGNPTTLPLPVFIAMPVVRTLAANEVIRGVALETIVVLDGTQAVPLIPDRVDSQSNRAHKRGLTL